MTRANTSKEEVLKFLQKNTTAVVATVSRDNSPQAATVFYVVDEEFNFYFMTKPTTRKYQNLILHSAIALVVGVDDNTSMTVQIEGQAHLVTDHKEKIRLLEQLFEVAHKKADQWPPLLKMEGKGSALFHIIPSWIRCFRVEDDNLPGGIKTLPFEMVEF